MRRFLAFVGGVVTISLALPAFARAQAVEVEPNNDLIQADAAPHFAGDVMISGSISPAGDVDVFRLNVAADTVLRIESFDYAGDDCPFGLATTIRLRNAGGAELNNDSASGIGACGALVLQLPAGTYYVSIEETLNDAAIPGYKLEFKVQTPGGSEVEPNDSLVDANPIIGSDVYVQGLHSDTDDFFAITVPAGASIRVEVIEVDALNTCVNRGVDTTLNLFDPAGILAASDTNSGRGFCSLIDGTGAGPLHAGAHDLPGGTYYLQVAVGGGAGFFDYRLVVRVVRPDHIFADDFEAGVYAQVVINEFNANMQSLGNCDLLELRVVSGGSMNGYSLRERNLDTLAVFTGLTVATNDLIVVHMNAGNLTCNPGGSANETTTPSQYPAVIYPGNYDTAYDWHSSDTNLTATDNVFTLYDDQGRIMDAVLTADDPTGTAAAASESQAAVVAAAGEWQTVEGGIPPGGFVDDNFRAHAVQDLNGTGTTAAGTSIQRNTNVDSNDLNGWTTGAGAPQTWGMPNSGQTPN